MKISVIIPAYNCEKTISRCIESILHQTYKNIEIIIVNDGSKDSTGAIISKYAKKDNRIIFIDNENHGVSYSRNIGIKKSTGDYISFVDADDYLENDCLEKLVPYLEKRPDFLRYNLKVFGGKSFNNDLYDLCNKEYNFEEDNTESIYKHFFTNYQRIPCLVMLLLVKKDVLKRISFNEKLTMMEDVDFYLQLFSESKTVLFLDKKLYNYYVNPDSVTHNSLYFKKNIFGVLDTNKFITKRIQKSKYEYLIPEINVNHLRTIIIFIKKLFKDNREEYKETVKELKKNKQFKKMLENYKLSPMKNKIILFLLKYDSTTSLSIYLSISEKIKDFLKKEKGTL